MSKIELVEEVARLMRLLARIERAAHDGILLGQGGGAILWREALESIERAAKEEK